MDDSSLTILLLVLSAEILLLIMVGSLVLSACAWVFNLLVLDGDSSSNSEFDYSITNQISNDTTMRNCMHMTTMSGFM